MVRGQGGSARFEEREREGVKSERESQREREREREIPPRFEELGPLDLLVLKLTSSS